MMTIKCVRCLKRKAKIFGGHVTRGRETILAGWCDATADCRAMRDHAGQPPMGWCGHWLPQMGVVPA